MTFKTSDIKLPAVKKVTIEVIPPFDADFIRVCLKKKKFDIEGLIWPEAVKAMFRNTCEAENKLKHIRSCCDKALKENITPFKDYLWTKIIKYSVTKEV